MKYLIMCFVFVAVFTLSGTARAQEPELVTEIVARVNNEIITRADYLKSVGEFKDEVYRQFKEAGKSEAEAEAEFQKVKGTVLDLIIENMLLEQKAKELSIDVEAEVNQQMMEIAKQNNFKNITDFEAALKQQGIDPEAARASLRQKLLQNYVVQKEVLGPIFQSLSEKDKLAFYEKNKKYFTTPAEATISEIFLSLDNQTADEVTQRAKRIVAELRGGKNFAEAVQQYSAATRASRALGGKLGTFNLGKEGGLKPDMLAAIKDLKTGEVTEPLRQQDGFQIIHIDEMKPEATLPYTHPDVQNVVGRGATMERADEARKKYVKKLREEAFIKISDGYVTAEAKPENSKSEKQ
jgi:parvulin-like peptidyl-prolyl isomerase